MNKSFERMMNGFHWVYTTDDKKHELSIILHDSSYGHEHGYFETMCSWLPDVQGNLDFGQVQTKIKHIYELEKLGRDKLKKLEGVKENEN